jgi:hypothetical protein
VKLHSFSLSLYALRNEREILKSKSLSSNCAQEALCCSVALSLKEEPGCATARATTIHKLEEICDYTFSDIFITRLYPFFKKRNMEKC